jgi:hypothetical protein
VPPTVDDRDVHRHTHRIGVEIARSTMAVASLNEMFISLFLRSIFGD